MAKRLTDTDKWKDDWYLSLSNDDKIVWQWLLDNCSHAGVCKRSLTLLNMMCRVSYTEDDLVKKMDGRILLINNIWFIPKFIKFQYATLNSAKPVIISVVKELFSYDLIKMIPESYGNDYKIISKSFENHFKMIKDKDKDKDKYKGVQGKEKLKGVRYSEDGEYVIFSDGSLQELGAEQLEAAKRENYKKPNLIIKGSVF